MQMSIMQIGVQCLHRSSVTTKLILPVAITLEIVLIRPRFPQYE